MAPSGRKCLIDKKKSFFQIGRRPDAVRTAAGSDFRDGVFEKVENLKIKNFHNVYGKSGLTDV